jgi:hypothetical protein
VADSSLKIKARNDEAEIDTQDGGNVVVVSLLSSVDSVDRCLGRQEADRQPREPVLVEDQTLTPRFLTG